MLISYLCTATCIILPLIVFVYLFVYKWRHRRTTKLLRSFYTVSALPLVGHTPRVVSSMKYRIPKLINFFKHWDYPATMRIFHIPLVILGTADMLQTVFHTSHDRGLLNKCKHSFENGILLATGEQWRKSRRIIGTAFSSTMMQCYLKIFNQYSAKLIEKLKQHADTDNAIDIWEYVANLNLDLIFETMTDHKLNTLENDDYEYFDTMERCSDEDTGRYTQPLLYLDWMYEAYLNITGKWKLFKIAFEKPAQILQKKMIQFNQSPEDRNSSAEDKRKTLLDSLVKVHQVDPTYDEKVMQDDLVNVTSAGSVTTARTTAFTLLMLAIHQDAQDKVYQEIKQILPNNSSIEMDDISKLVYLEQCIKETLRKFPSIPITFRKHDEDIVLNDKQTIPANCHIVINLIALHHNPKIYENPFDWNPDNFDPEVTSKRDKYAYLPFGAGPRTCIGAKYAMISLKTQLAHLLRTYRFTTDMKMEDLPLALGMNVVLRSENGYWMKLWYR